MAAIAARSGAEPAVGDDGALLHAHDDPAHMTRKPTISLRTLLGVLISVASIFFVVRWASGQEAPELPGDAAGYGLVAGAIAVYALLMIVRGWRWHRMLVWAGVEVPTRSSIELVTIGYGANTILPARGGEALRIALMARRTGAGFVPVAGTVVAERLLDGALLVLLFAAVVLSGVGDSPGGIGPVLGALGVLAAAAFTVLGYYRLRRAGRLRRFAARINPYVTNLRILWHREGLALGVVTLLVWLGEAGVYLMLAEALGASMSPLEAVFLNTLVTFCSLVPAAPGYVGTFDGALLFGLHAVDVSGATATGLVLLVRFVIFVPVTVVAIALLGLRYGGLHRARELLGRQPRVGGEARA